MSRSGWKGKDVCQRLKCRTMMTGFSLEESELRGGVSDIKGLLSLGSVDRPLEST
jgi:hypothetical protein